jgi:hypothetical protein
MTPMKRWASTVMILAMVVGCGGSTVDGGSSGGGAGTSGASGSGGTGGAGGSSSGSGGSGGDVPCAGIAPCCDSQGNPVSPICPGGRPAECPPGTTAPPTGICAPETGCSPSQPCSAAHYCDYPDDLCGAAELGKCTPKPQGCDLLYAPVCGCDGKVHGNDCAARSAGSDVSSTGGCTPPVGQFACGPIFCALGSQYCQHGVSDVGGIPDDYACKELPAGCGKTPTCACLSAEPCGDWCASPALGEIRLTCPGG